MLDYICGRSYAVVLWVLKNSEPRFIPLGSCLMSNDKPCTGPCILFCDCCFSDHPGAKILERVQGFMTHISN